MIRKRPIRMTLSSPRSDLTATFTPNAIELVGVEKRFGEDDERVVALTRTDVRVKRGELLVLIGPSGCGKTTMLRMMAGLEKPTSGDIRVAGRNLWAGDRRDAEAVKNLGVVFQDANLFPWLTIEKNIALPLEMRGVQLAERRRRVAELTKLVGISGFETKWPRQLSVPQLRT
jgi:NitT/TauT family transport system ATP-binding protein